MLVIRTALPRNARVAIDNGLLRRQLRTFGERGASLLDATRIITLQTIRNGDLPVCRNHVGIARTETLELGQSCTSFGVSAGEYQDCPMTQRA